MKLAVLREVHPGERRVALVPTAIKPLIGCGLDVFVESQAGIEAGFQDEDYRSAGAEIATRDECFSSDVVVQVRGLGANPKGLEADLAQYRSSQIVIATCDPLGAAEPIRSAAEKGVSVLALETHSSNHTGSDHGCAQFDGVCGRLSSGPAGCHRTSQNVSFDDDGRRNAFASKAFVIGAGVAGLQAIATARRMGAVVQAYDVRPAVREQVESLGAKFVELELEAEASEDKGGYAKQMARTSTVGSGN